MSKDYSHKIDACCIAQIIILLIAIILCFAVIICGMIRPFNKAFYNQRKVIAIVTEKAVKNNSSESKYLIYTKDLDGNIETYEITDSVLRFRFDSSDIYAGIEVGKTYEFKVAGSRIKAFSWYSNIYEYTEVKE
jgi:hypothetical protein